MAITRCPYCRAIIDEKDPYCSNCGTQLLFPEDETADEDIPGEKIVEVEVEEKDYEIPEPGAESAPSAAEGLEDSELDPAGEDEDVIALPENAADDESAEGGEVAEDEVIVLEEAEAPPAEAPDEPSPPQPSSRRSRSGRPPRQRAAAEEPISALDPEPESGNGTAEKSRPARKRGRSAKTSRRESVIVVDDAAPASGPAIEPADEAASTPAPFSAEPQETAGTFDLPVRADDHHPQAPPEAAESLEVDEPVEAVAPAEAPISSETAPSPEGLAAAPGIADTATVRQPERTRRPSKPKPVFGSTPMPMMPADPDLPSEPDRDHAAGSAELPGPGAPKKPAGSAPGPGAVPAAAMPPDDTIDGWEPMASPPAAPGAPGRALTFDTRDLDRMGPTVDVSRDEIERFFKVLEDKEKESERRPPGSVDLSDILPPWARGMKQETGVDTAGEPRSDGGAEAGPGTDEMGRPEDDTGAAFGDGTRRPLRSDETGEDLDAGGEDEAFARPPLRRPSKAADSGVGLPEKIAQRDLPFDAATRDDDDDEEEGEEEEYGLPAGEERSAALRRPAQPRVIVREETEAEAEEGEGPAAAPLRLSDFLKGKLFDAVFVLAFWLTGVALATRLLRASLPGLLRTAGLPLAIFYAVLLLFYLFLFRFFLGETLGDRLFRDRPDSEPRHRE